MKALKNIIMRNSFTIINSLRGSLLSLGRNRYIKRSDQYRVNEAASSQVTLGQSNNKKTREKTDKVVLKLLECFKFC